MNNEAITISADELRQLVRESVQEGFRDVGLHAGDPERLEEVRADFRFVRKLRKSIESTASKVVTVFMVSVAGGAATAFAMGFKTMVGGKP